MSRIMRDSVTYTDIPRGTSMVAGYVDGVYAWSDAAWAYHKGSQLVRISALGATLDADVIDIETGNVTAAQGAAWAARKQAAGQYPTAYFQLSRWNEVEAAFGKAGVHSFGIWVAAWGTLRTIPKNAIALQYANPTLTGHHYDESIVVDYPHWPGVDVPPSQLPPPVPPPVPPVGPPAPPIDQARLAWGRLGALFTTAVPQAVIALEKAVQDIKSLP